MKCVVIYNPHSGNALPLDKLRRRFKKAKITLVDTLPLGDNTKQQLEPYLNKQNTVIAGFGGDGTLSSIANMLVNTGAVFAPLPGGTLNHFTKDLGISQNLDEALANLNSSKPRKIDVGCVNDKIFLNNSAIGLYPSALQMRDEMKNQALSKWFTAVIASFKAFIRYRSYVIEVENEEFQSPFVFIGNNDYRLEDRPIGDRTKLNQGLLSVYAVQASSRWTLLKVFCSAVIGRLTSTDEIKIWKTKTVTIKTNRSTLCISHDGEHERVQTPLTYTIISGGLTVIGSL